MILDYNDSRIKIKTGVWNRVEIYSDYNNYNNSNSINIVKYKRKKDYIYIGKDNENNDKKRHFYRC